MTKAANDSRVNSSLLGAAAEHYVMSQLLRRGKLAALAPTGMPFADILVCDEHGTALSALQVKARTYGLDGGWHMNRKHEDCREKLHIYCFVDFGVDLNGQPRCWIVPSAIVADALKTSYQTWLQKPGKGGKPHRDYPGRRLRPDYSDIGLTTYTAGWLNAYEGDWDLIAAEASAETSN